MPNLIPGHVPEGGANKDREVTIEFVANLVSTPDSNTHTFTNISIGKNANDRTLVIGVAAAGGSAFTYIDSVTVDGNTAIATSGLYFGGNTLLNQTFYLPWPYTTETANIVVTFDEVRNRCGIAVYQILNTNGGIPSVAKDWVFSGATAGDDFPSNHRGVGAAFAMVKSANNTFTWGGDGVVEEHKENVESYLFTSASINDAGYNGNSEVTLDTSNATACSVMTSVHWPNEPAIAAYHDYTPNAMSSGDATNTHTWNSLNTTGKHALVLVSCEDLSTTETINNVTIDGNVMEEVISLSSGGGGNVLLGMYILNTGGGLSNVDVVVHYDQVQPNSVIGIMSFDNLQNSTPIDTASNTLNSATTITIDTLTNPSEGGVIMCLVGCDQGQADVETQFAGVSPILYAQASTHGDSYIVYAMGQGSTNKTIEAVLNVSGDVIMLAASFR
jgi:hypothetical protein